MKRLSINAIKNDIKNGYGYMEYEFNYYNGQLTIINEVHESNVLVNYERDNQSMTYAINRYNFLKMSRHDFNKCFSNNLYYNMQTIQ
jgi:hypothetical protein